MSTLRSSISRGVSCPALFALCLGALAACSGEQRPVGFCENDGECPGAGTRCNLETKLCICTSDEACKDGQFCNGAGICQDLAGCLTSFECADNTFCDAVSGQCLAGPPLQLMSPCGIATHCPYGTVCKEAKCEVGCFDDGDCVLGQLCLDGFCATGEGICATDSFCDYRERCVGQQCRRDFRGPYCRGCSQPSAVNPFPCDEPKNFCLVNSSETGGHPFFCGVDCSLGQPCPNGYGCHGILILTENPCTFEAQCKCDPAQIRLATRTCTITAACDPRRPDGMPDPNATHCVLEGYADCNPGGTGDAACLVGRGLTSGSCTCDTDDDCADGGKCVGGACCTGPINDVRQCFVGEGRVSGFCSCATDDDCPRDSCNTAVGSCELTGRPCTPGGNECGPVPCVEGACLIGQNCAPDEGLSCSIVGG